MSIIFSLSPAGSGDTADLPPLKLRPDPPVHPSTVKHPLSPTHDSLPNTQSNKLIQEISTESNTRYKGESTKVCVPEHTICVKEVDEKQGERVCASVSLPGVASVREIELDVSKVSITYHCV